MKALVWPVATYGCESWTLRNDEETRLDAFEMKGLRKILRFSCAAKKTNEWVLNKAGVKRQLLQIVKTRKLAYYGHTMRQEAQLSPSDRAMRLVSSNLANYHATVQKLLIRQVLTKPMV